MRARRGRPGRLAVDSCAGEFEARTPYYYLSHEAGDGDETPRRRDRRARLGREPDRPGDRVRLLLRAGGAGVPAARARGRARELEPGDGLDRLRHLRPALPRAGHARARARRRRARAAARRRRLARRPDAARARGRSRRGGRAAARRPAGRDRPGRGPRPLRRPARGARRCARPPGATPRRRRRRARSRSGSATPCSSGRRTCSAAAACASPGARRSSSSTARPSSTASSKARSSSTSTCSATANDGWVAAIVEHVERAGVHSGDSACVLPAPSVGERLEAEIRELAATLARGLGARGLLNLQLAPARRRALRARGEPARVADGAVRRQGDRDPARRPRVPAAARRLARRARAAGACRAAAAPGRRRRSSRRSASRAPPTAASRCARPAR